MSNVVSMHKDGFLCCPQCGGDNWSVVCANNAGKPFVAYLVCISQECKGEFELEIMKGYLP